MDVIAKEIRKGLPWELLYADDLVLMAESEQELVEKMSSWQAALEGKGLKVNAGKSKVMVSSADAGETEKTGEYPCGVCYAGVGANSIRCNNCTNWVHRRCSGISGSLQAASKTFICKRCQGMVSQRDTSGLANGLELQGRKFEAVDKFCYLGDMLAARGGETAAVTARIQSAWKKFRELSPFLTSRATPLKVKGKVYDACVRKCMTYGSETWATKSSSVERIEKAEMRMVRWMCRASLCDRKRNEDLLQSLGLVKIGQVMRKSRLRWFGHVARREESHWLQRILNFPVAGRNPCGRPRKSWEETIKEDRRASNITHIDPTDRTTWRRAIKEMYCPTPQSGKNGH